MKAMMLTGIRNMTMHDVDTPVVSRDKDVLVRVMAVGVCGSDVHYYVHGRIGSQVVDYPFTVGHECAGIVEKTGPMVTQHRPGDRVALDCAISCGVCDQCLTGRPNTCRRIRFHSCPGQGEGCLSEYILVPEENCFPISDSITMEEAAFSEPLSCGLYSVDGSMPMEGARIGVFGCGPIGLSVLMSARVRGAERVYISEPLEYRRRHALELGATWAGDPRGDDVPGAILAQEPLGLRTVFECCGDNAALDLALEVLSPGGELVIVGIPDDQRISLDLNTLRVKEITVRTVRRQAGRTAAALRMMERGFVNVDALITHRFPFDDAKDAFELVSAYGDGVVKAMIMIS
jgi:L-iditol 2-dehydrogenase